MNSRWALLAGLLAGVAAGWQAGPVTEEPPAKLLVSSGLEDGWEAGDGARWIDDARSAPRAARVARSDDRTAPVVSTSVPVPGPGRYVLSAWFRPDMRATPDANYMAGLDVEWLDTDGRSLGRQLGPAANGRSATWLYREETLTAPPGAAAARWVFGFRTTAIGQCDIDDVSLRLAESDGALTGRPLRIDLRPARSLWDPSEPATVTVRLLEPRDLAEPVRLHLTVRDSLGHRLTGLESLWERPSQAPWTHDLAVDAGRLPTGEWCAAEVIAEADGCLPATATVGRLALARPTDFSLPTDSPFAILEGHPYLQRWLGARWQRPNWNWNVREMELSRRYGVTLVALVGAADEALAGRMSLADYAAFVEESVRRFSGLVSWWQLGNEPPLYQRGIPERYVAVLKAGYEAAKRADPHCRVVMAGITGLDVDPDMVDKVLAAGGGEYCDALDVHLYLSVPRMDTLLTKVRADMAKHHCDKPLICTEVTADVGAPLTPRETAGHVYKRYAVGLAHGLAQIYWFVMRWPNPNVPFNYCGLIDNTTEAPVPAAAAYAGLAGALAGTRYVDRAVDPTGVWRTTFERPDRRVVVLWTEAATPTNLTLPFGDGAIEVIDVAGRRLATASRGGRLTVTATSEPLVIIGPPGGEPTAVASPPAPSAIVVARGATARVEHLGDAERFDAPAGIEVFPEPGFARVTVGPATAVGSATLTALGPGLVLRAPLTVTEPLTVDVAPNPAGPAFRVTVRNLGSETLTGALRLTSTLTDRPTPVRLSAPFADLAPGEAARLDFPAASPNPSARYTTRVVAETAPGARIEISHSLVFAAARRCVTPPTIDGRLDDWSDLWPIRVDTLSGERSDPDDGPPRDETDLSARAAVQWDADRFYVAIAVRDDIHHNDGRDGSLWDGDSVQLGFAPQPDRSGAPAAEWGAALTTVGPQAWCWRNTGGRPTGPAAIPLAIVRDEAAGVTVYELAFPWSALPDIAAEPDTWFGFGLLVNESDGANRGYYGWHAGIGGDKDPSQYGQVTLIP